MSKGTACAESRVTRSAAGANRVEFNETPAKHGSLRDGDELYSFENGVAVTAVGAFYEFASIHWERRSAGNAGECILLGSRAVRASSSLRFRCGLCHQNNEVLGLEHACGLS